jgi:hypothetical protein
VNFKIWDPEKDEDCPGYKKFIKHMRALYASGLRPKDGDYRSKVAF